MIGVYKITNLITGFVYIGSSIAYDKRVNSHKSNLNRGAHSNPFLQKDWELFGSEAFNFEFIRACQESELPYLELVYINSLNPQYNMVKAVGRGKDMRKNMSLATKRYYHALTEEQKTAKNRYKVGRVFTDETRLKLSQKASARKWSAETKRKISATLKSRLGGNK